MDELPVEMIRMILDYLSILEKGNCRLVNKKFKSIIDSKFDQLIILDSTLDINTNWFYTNRRHNENYRIFVDFKLADNDLLRKSRLDKVKKFLNVSYNNMNSNWPFKNKSKNELVFLDFKFFENGTFHAKSSFLGIKKLFISADFKLDVEKIINKFNRLEELEIHARKIRNGQMNLPNLNILCLCGLIIGDIQLNTPNLSFFKSNGTLEKFNFVYPGQIKYLDLPNDHSSIGQFTNLEYLYCEQYHELLPEIVTKLEKLKEIHFIGSSNSSHFEKIGAEIEKLNLDHLKLFKFGLELKFYPETPYRAQNLQKNEINDQILTILKNYSNLIDTLPFINHINYSSLLKVFKTSSKIPTDLSYKFPNIRKVLCLDVIDDIDHFFNFLKNFKNLDLLQLNCESLTDQNDYDRLPQLCPNLTELFLKDIDDLVEIDFNFILKFRYLSLIDLDTALDKQLIKSFFTDLKHLRRLFFIYQTFDSEISFDRREHPSFQFFKIRKVYKFNCLNDLINFLKE